MSDQNGGQGFDPFALEPEEKPARRGGAGIAWLALVVALAVAGFNGYQWWLERQAGDSRAGERALIESLNRQQADLAREVQALRERLSLAEQDDGSEAVAGLERAVADLRRQMADLDSEFVDAGSGAQSLQAALFELQQSLAALETTVAAQAAREESPGQRLDLYEVESLLRMASERLQLFSEPRAADQALAMADERLAAMDDPLYLPVRQRIGRARQALAGIELPDVVLIEGRISALQAAIARLPFPGDSPLPAAASQDQAAGIWGRLKQTLAGLVTVRRRVPDEPDALSLDDMTYLKQGLWMQLESARLSLMRHDGQVYARSLQRARGTLADNFDMGAASAQSFASEIDALLQVGIEVEMPDISAPWGQLRLQRERAGLQQPPSAEAPAAGPEEQQSETSLGDEAAATEPPPEPAAAGTGEG